MPSFRMGCSSLARWCIGVQQQLAGIVEGCSYPSGEEAGAGSSLDFDN